MIQMMVFEKSKDSFNVWLKTDYIYPSIRDAVRAAKKALPNYKSWRYINTKFLDTDIAEARFAVISDLNIRHTVCIMLTRRSDNIFSEMVHNALYFNVGHGQGEKEGESIE